MNAQNEVSIIFIKRINMGEIVSKLAIDLQLIFKKEFK